MTAPSPALIPIDPQALAAFFVALAQHGVPSDIQSVLLSGSLQWRVKPHAAKAAIRAYLAASPLPAVVEAATNVVFGSAIVMAGDGFSNSSVVPKARLTELDAALAALKGGNDAG